MTSSNAELRLQDYGITLLRVVLGAIFLAHGAQKAFQYGWEGTVGAFVQLGIPLPGLSAGLVIAAELLGGSLLVVGLATRLAAVPLAVTMAVALVAVHLPQGFFLPQGIEFTLVLLAGTVALTLTGPGALALDGALSPSLEPARVTSLARRDGARYDAAA